MLIKLENDLYNEIEDITMTDYCGIKIKNYTLVDVENLESMLDDLKTIIEKKDNMYRNLQQDIEDNYRPLKPSEMGWE